MVSTFEILSNAKPESNLRELREIKRSRTRSLSKERREVAYYESHLEPLVLTETTERLIEAAIDKIVKLMTQQQLTA